MKPFLHTQTCHISTLTPVHIGCGEDYYPTNYVIDGGYLHYFGELQLVEALSPEELQEIGRLAEIRDGKTAIRRIQKFVQNQSRALVGVTQHTVSVSPAIHELYRDTVDGKKDLNKLAIQRNTHNPHTQQGYIPGSSIKGSIRTAILNTCLEQNSHYKSELKEAVSEAMQRYGNASDKRYAKRDIQRTIRQTGRDVQGELLNYRKVTEDPMRLLKIGDAEYAHPDALNGLEVRYAVNRKKVVSTKKSMAEERDLYTLLECLSAHRSRSFKMELTLLSGSELASWKQRLPFESIRELADLCNGYYFPRLCDELEKLSELNHGGALWLETLQGLLKGELRQALVKQQAFLLRIGKHSGADSNTLDDVRCIEIMQRQGQPPKFLDHATTLWLAADSKDQQGGMLPFGWVLVEFDGADLPETHAFLRRNAQAAYDRLEHEQEQRAEATRARVEREEAAREARRRAEEDAAQARAEAERQAALSENQRRAEALREAMTAASKGKGPGSQLFSRLRGLIQEAPDWPEDDRRTLYDVAVAVFDWLGIKKDDGNRKKLLRSLNAP